MYYSRRIVALVAAVVILTVLGAVVVLRPGGSPQANRAQDAQATAATSAKSRDRDVKSAADFLAGRLNTALQTHGSYDAAVASRTIQVWRSALAARGASALLSRATRTVVVDNGTECVAIKIAATGQASASKPEAC